MELDPAATPAPDADSPLPAVFAPPLPPSAELLERLEDYARAAQGSFSPNTLRALAADSRIFAAWCNTPGLPMLPAAPRTIAAFLDAQAETKSRATLERYRSSIVLLHRAAGLPNPCTDEIVRLALKRISRAKGRRQKQAEPLNRPSVDRMLAVKETPRLHQRVAEAARPVPVIVLRNAALLAVAYDTLLRRSELVGLRVEDLQWSPDGSGTILVRKTKTDQEGEGAVKYLAPDTLAHVAAWLETAGITEGPLFRAVTKGGKVGQSPLSDNVVPRLFRQAASIAGVALARAPSGHSTRVGATQDMFATGFELLEVMQAGSWNTPAMPARYGERLRAQRGAARKLATLQNRA